MEISKKTKLELYKTLEKEESLIFDPSFEKWMPFLDNIWNLRTLPSEDARYTNAYDDVVQHTVNNDDLTHDELFIERLKLLENDQIFIKFIEHIINPEFRENEDDIVRFVLIINSYLEKENLILTIVEYTQSSLPIYKLTDKKTSSTFIDLIKNEIPFYTRKDHFGYSGQAHKYNEPEVPHCFVLVFNQGWNDNGFYTEYSLFHNKDDEQTYIGIVKITDGNQEEKASLPDSFTELDNSFCSLGQSYEFYTNLKKVTGHKFESVLYALKDAAFYSDIYDKFEQNYIFQTSLIRYDDSEQLLREVKHKIYGYDLNNLYSFDYEFLPKYASESEIINFDFNSDEDLPNRIYAIIGKNGTGKTQLITSLPLEISKKDSKNFTPRTPMFSKVITISYSIFDNFERPNKTSAFNYVYCGLLDKNKNLLSEKEQTLRFHETCIRLESIERVAKLKETLSSFIQDDLLNKLIVKEPTLSGGFIDKIKIQEFTRIKTHLSSGQNILIYIISEIIANIRKDSLLLFDEPETHLHPNAISQLMNVIYDIVHQFESYCIITTHSPLIIQELFSQNVRIIDRHENTVSVRNIAIESFGQNLTTLTEEVFGNKEIGKQYKKIIDRIIRKTKQQALQASSEQIFLRVLSKLENDNLPLSLNARLYVKSQIV